MVISGSVCALPLASLNPVEFTAGKHSLRYVSNAVFVYFLRATVWTSGDEEKASSSKSNVGIGQHQTSNFAR